MPFSTFLALLRRYRVRDSPEHNSSRGGWLRVPLSEAEQRPYRGIGLAVEPTPHH
jgi:hypothetical protein